MAKVPDIAEPGTLVVGASDPSKRQYSENGRLLMEKPAVFEGGHVANLYLKHASKHGDVLSVQQHVKQNKKTKKVTLQPNAPKTEVGVESDASNAADVQPVKNKVEIVDVVDSVERNAIIMVFKDEDAVAYTPNPGDVFDLSVIDKLSKQTRNYKVFSPNIIFSLPDCEKVYMVLVLANESDDQ